MTWLLLSALDLLKGRDRLGFRMELVGVGQAIENAQLRIDAYDFPAPETPWCWLPAYRDEASVELTAANTKRLEIVSRLATRVERELRAGGLQLRGRSDLTAPLGLAVAPHLCKDLKFDTPQACAVHLADGRELFACEIDVPPAGACAAKPRTLSMAADKERIRIWMEARIARGVDITQVAAEKELGALDPPVPRDRVRATLRAVGQVGERGRPRKKAQIKSPD